MALSYRPKFNTWNSQEQAQRTLESQFGFGQAVAENAVAGFLSSYGIGTVARELMTPQPNTPLDPLRPQFSELPREIGNIGAMIRGDKPEPTMTKEEFDASPDFRKAIPYEEGMTKSRLAALSAEYDVAEARAMMSQKEWGGAFLGQFLGQMLDPINYVPFTGQATTAAAVARAGGILGRIGVSAVDAAISTAVFGVATAQWRKTFGDNISFEAMAQEIAMSMVIGGAFGGGLGLLSIPGDRRAREQRILNSSRAVAQAESLRDVYGRMAILKDGTGQAAAGRLDDGMMPGARAEFERQVAKFQENIRIQEERDIGRAVEARTITQRAEIDDARAELASLPAESPRAVELSQRVVELETYVQQIDTAYRAQRELVARGVANEPGGAAAARALPPVADGMTRIYSTTDPAADMVAGGTEAPASSRRSRLAAQRKAFSTEAPDGDGWYADVPTEGTEVSGQPMAWQQIPKPEAPPVSPFRRLLINRFMEAGRPGEEGLALAKTFESAYANLSSRAGWTPEKMLQEYPLPEVVYSAPDASAGTFNQSAVERLENRAPVRSPRGATYMGVGPQYTVPNPNADAPALQRNAPLIQASTNAGNADVQSEALDALLKKHPSPLSSEEAWVALANDAFSLDRVPMPPFRTIEIMRDGPEAVAKEISKLSDGMVRDAEAGLATAKEFGEVYSSGQATPDITAKAFLWSFLSRGVSPYVQESAFLDAIVSDTLTSIMQRATREGWNDGLQAEYDAWATSAIPPGSPGRGTQHNLNAFGRNFLRVMTQRHDDAGGRTGLEIIHDMIADGTPSYLIRREFLKRGDGAGIDNKVVSFTLLLLGRSDVLVLDRVQVRNQWNDGRFDGQNIYDSEIDADGKQVSGSAFAEMTFGHKGLLYYETMERALEPSIKQAYASLGREGSLGRYHWDSWLLASNQEVGHASVEGLLRDAQKNNAPYVGTFVRQGKYTNYDYGFRYGVLPDGKLGTVVQRLSGDGAVVLPYDVVSDSKGPLRKGVSKLQAKAKSRGAEYGTTVPWTAGLTKEERIQYDATLESSGTPAPNLWADDANAVGRENAAGKPDQAGADAADGETFNQSAVEAAARRYVGGLSIEQSKANQGVDFKPGDADMAALQARIQARVGAGGEVRASKVLSTEGRYGDPERSVDLEVLADANYDPTPLWKHLVAESALAKQDAVFLAREIEALDEVDPTRHTPGVELLFDAPVSGAELEARLAELAKYDVKFLTVMVGGEPKTPGAMSDAIGIRMLHMPEFERRYGGDDDLMAMDDAALGDYIEARARAMTEQVHEVISNIPGMTGRVGWFDTNTAFGADYGRVLGDGSDVQPAGMAEDGASAAGGEVWRGQQVRERLAAADRHVAYLAQREANAGGGDAGPAEGTFNQGGRRAGGYSLGKLAPLEGAPNVEGASGPDLNLIPVAEQYARENGIDLRRQSEFVEVDPDRAARIAAAYDAMPHAPDDPKVKAAYQELIRQTVDQYRALEAAGFKFWLFDGATDPYGGNPWNAMRDLRKNKTMGVYATADGFGSGATELDVSQNPLLVDTGIRWPAGTPDGPLQPVLANDLFRAVHDAFGHGIEGAGFRARGEENAWQAHSRLFYGDALGAITSETRGQNSWLNYGPYGEKNRTARVEDTVFADQKTGLMPEWTWREGRAGDAPDTSNQSGRASDELIFQQAGSRVLQRTPELQDAARAVAAGEMTPEAYTALVERYKPVTPYADVPEPASVEDMQRALTSDKVGRIGATDQLEAGHKVGLRLDIPAYANNGVWVVSVHEQQAGFSAGPSIGYTSVARASNVTMGVVEKAALAIAQGKPKGTIATIKGDWVPSSPEEAKAAAAAALADPAWRQAGMDPERASFFYDRETMQPITAAEEVIQIGPLVLAKNPTYADTGSFLYQPAYHGSPKVFDKFKWSDETRGTGEGAQAFGDGLYFAGKKEVAQYYRDQLAKPGMRFDGKPYNAARAMMENKRDTESEALATVYSAGGVDQAIDRLAGFSARSAEQQAQINEQIAWLEANRDRIEVEASTGRLYKVDIPDDDELLAWDAPLSEQSAVLSKVVEHLGGRQALIAKAEEFERMSTALLADSSRQAEWDAMSRDPAVRVGELLQRMQEKPNQFGYGGASKVTGERLYRALGDPVKASALLRDLGVPGHRFLDQPSRVAGEGSYNYVIYDDSRVNIIDYEQEVRNDASTWEADTGRKQDEPRGQIQFKDGKSLMKLFDGADSSTALHESGHHFLMMIKSMAERTDTGPGIKEDWAQVKSWLAVNAKDVARESGTNITADDVLAVLNRNTSGDRMKDIAINRGIHEQWARGFEAYLLEGKSPSTGMRGVFESFKKWLGAIYASAKSLNVNLTPEIRQVFDRLLTDEAATPERAVVTAPERPAGAPTLEPPPVEQADAGLVTAAAAVGKSENVAGFEEQIGAKLDGTYTEEGDIEMLRSLGRVLPEEEAMLKQADDGYADAVAYEKAIKVALACVIP